LLPVSLEDALRSAVTKTIKAGDTLSVPHDEVWLILYGGVSHTTGTNSVFTVYSEAVQNANVTFKSLVDTAQASNSYPLMHTAAGYAIGQSPAFCVVQGGDILSFTGGTASQVNLRIAKLMQSSRR
jgi:hypothetical protein